MSFVDGHQSDAPRNVFDHGNEALVVQSFRGAVENSQFRVSQLGVDALEVLVLFGRVDAVGRDALLPQDVDLVLHQGKEGGYNNGDTGAVPHAVHSIELGKGKGGDLGGIRMYSSRP